jgi:DnaJ-class molecular chaperone
MSEIKLREGEELCKRCEGHGTIVSIRASEPKIPQLSICNHCDGRGKYDWVERAVGRIDPKRPYTKEAEDWIIRDMMNYIRGEGEHEERTREED